MSLEYTFQESVLTSLPDVDEWRSSAGEEEEWTRSMGNNLDVLVSTADAATNATTNAARAVCHVVALDSFHKGYAGSGNSSGHSDYERAAAVALALHHLNTGDGSLIPELKGLSDRCSIRFSLEFINTASRALTQVASVLSRNELLAGRPPCAFLGAGTSSVSTPSSILTGFRGFPQLSPTATSSDLSDRGQHPLFGRVIPSDADNAVVYLKFFRYVLKIEHLCLLNSGSDHASFGAGLVDNIIHLAPTVAPDLKLWSITLHGVGGSMKDVIARILKRQYRYVWTLIEPDQELHDALLEEAVRQGLIGPDSGFQWFFGDSFHSILHGRQFEDDSVLQQAYHGVGLLEATGEISDRAAGLSQQLQSLDNPMDLQYLESILPSPPLDQEEGIITGLQSTLVQGSSNVGFSVFAYEAAVALGLGACHAVVESSSEGDYFLSGGAHFENILNTTFTGVAGNKISLDPNTGSRYADTVFYRVRNYVPETLADGDGDVFFRDVTTHVYQNGAWEQLADFTFAGGTLSIPPDIPPPDIQEEIVSTGVRVTLLIMCALIICQAVGFSYWTACHRKSRVILASQPIFLHAICFGIFIFGCAIIPMTLDHGVLNLSGCQKKCTSTVWLFSLGVAITLSAFVAKTHRVNRILNNPNKFKRIKVSARQVAAPMIVSLSLNIILLSVMTAVAPPQYQLQVEGVDSFGRVVQLEGRCDWTDASPYMIALAVLHLIVLMISGWESYKARNLSTEFSESRYVFRALLSTLAVTFVGLPLVFLVEDNPNALYFVTSAIIFVTSTAILVLTFGPKMRQLYELKKGDTGIKDSSKTGSAGASEMRRWKISGLEDPSPNRTNGTNGSAETATNTSPIASSERSGLEGMKILTQKSKSKLFHENEELEGRLRELQRLIDTSDSIESLRTALTSSTASGGVKGAVPTSTSAEP